MKRVEVKPMVNPVWKKTIGSTAGQPVGTSKPARNVVTIQHAQHEQLFNKGKKMITKI